MRVSFFAVAALFCALSVSFSPNAAAQPAAAQPTVDEASQTQKPPQKTPDLAPRTDLAPDGKREEPDYDGRPNTTTTGEDLLWVPRVLFFPIYAVTEFVVRRPLGIIVPAAEATATGGGILDIFRFGPNNNIAIVPKFYFESGFRPRIGFYLFVDDFIVKNNGLRATATTGGERWFKASALDRIPLSKRNGEVTTELDIRLTGLLRPDLLYWGTGPKSRREDKGVYELRTVGGGITARHHFDAVNRIEGWFNLRRDAFTDSECGQGFFSQPPADRIIFQCEDPSVSQRVAQGAYATPNGFSDPAVVGNTGFRLVLDSRDPWPAPGSGFAAEARGEFGARAGDASSEWVRYSGVVGAFIDLTGTRRVLSLALDVDAVDALDSADGVPFTELAGAKRRDDVPDPELMRGFTRGRLVGETATVATLEYAWPIWSFIDATMQASVGNVWGRRFADFALEDLRFSFAGGLRTPNRRDHTFNVLVGFGTAPFSEGATPEGPRVVIGSTTGF